MDSVTLKFWHGGAFKERGNGKLVYEGGKGKTMTVDVNELCYFDLTSFATRCGDYGKIVGLFYLIPGLSLEGGLREVVCDPEVLELSALALEHRSIDIYVCHDKKLPSVVVTNAPVFQNLFTPLATKKPKSPPKKMTPKRCQTKHVETPLRCSPRRKNIPPQQKEVVQDFSKVPATSSASSKENPPAQHFDNSETLNDHNLPPITQTTNQETDPNPLQTEKTLYPEKHFEPFDWEEGELSDKLSSDDTDVSDPLYKPAKCKLREVGEEDVDNEGGESTDGLSEAEEEGPVRSEVPESEFEEFLESENSDEEYKESRDKAILCNNKLHEIAKQLQREIEEGKVLFEEGEANKDHLGEGTSGGGDGNGSEYEKSDEEIHTPPDSGDEEVTRGKRKRVGELVYPNTDFTKFKWQVGQRFPSRQAFKDAVAKYAIYQGKNVKVTVSDKSRQQRVGIRCVKGCPLYLYASWDSRRATVVVKRVMDEHTCSRNTKKNRQLKSSWVAKQLLDIFKSRPHWPAEEIKETIRRGFKVSVTRVFAYNVKYAAHRLLHGSMHDHYRKIVPYIKALKAASPGTVLDLVTVPNETSDTVFQRLFTCYEGLKNGWVQGCRRVICVDGCFIKTFLGGQLLSEVGRDGNEQMYPIAWAVVEGENNCSWEWFFNHLQDCLQLGDGKGVAIISDEHQVSSSSLLLSFISPN
ncbi:Phosphoenolpyruvate carboxylase [Bienertia sinuspersici]